MPINNNNNSNSNNNRKTKTLATNLNNSMPKVARTKNAALARSCWSLPVPELHTSTTSTTSMTSIATIKFPLTHCEVIMYDHHFTCE